ncbi:extracellular sulfatase Sulf-2-like [Watersipora subatra]|uniref:extracellular sulfatase Sulf-2-like n=1 Tax=Watersipora subatra TaxID=2589382 RepID=UPI00355C0DA5
MAVVSQLQIVFAMTLLVIMLSFVSMAQGQRSRHRNTRPNIVIIMTDDQDIELGSMNYMPKTLRILQDGGAKFMNAFTNSPICCPSRSSFLTGLQVHNHNVWTNNVNCSSQYWQTEFEINSFATYLENSGYRTGYFGKYLNEYKGEHIPPGWKEWMGLVKNSAFYNYTVNYNGNLIKHGDDYGQDYFTDLIANDSLAFFKRSKLSFPNKPVTMVLSMPAPHGPEDSAPQYANMFHNITDHRLPNWNYAPNPDKDFLLRITGKMEPIQSHFADLLMRKRVMTLQSVDDAVEKVYNELRELGELDNTYMIYLSDHGYHLGQFGIPKGKSMPYEFDIRIPMYIRGPGIKPASEIRNLVGIIDIAPTLLDIAEVELPEQMDGKSLKPLLDDSYQSEPVQRKAWRDTFLIERGKLRKQLIEDDGVSENFMTIYFDKTGGVEAKCDKPAYQYPCRPEQKYYCYQDNLDRKRIRKCNKLTEKCACKESRRHKRKADTAFVQKCSVVEGEVQCSRLPDRIDSGKRQRTSFNDRRKALDRLIKDYREQLGKLKGLRKDLELNQNRVNLDRYILDGNVSDSSSRGRVFSDSNDVTPRAKVSFSNSKRERNLDCFCAKESQINDHDLHPKDLVLDIEEEEKMASALADEEFLTKREQKRLERQKKRDEKKQNREKGKCAEDDKTCLRRQKKKLESGKRNNPHCQLEDAECAIMDNQHWRTEPKWTMGPFCFCNNAIRNVFWCLRVINETDNFLYCEYIDDFLSYYDLNNDPWQLRNAIHDISYAQLGQLHELLNKMRKCKGAKECTHRHRNRLAIDSQSDNTDTAQSN